MTATLKPIWVSVDVEPDISRYLSGSFLGVESGLPRILGILKDCQVQADFFVTGDVAHAFPDSVRRIQADGHNLGSHSLTHDVLCGMGLADQVHVIERSIDLLKGITGERAKMFRAPNFGADGTSVQALERTKIDVDSSVLPGRYATRWKIRKIYDHRGAPRTPYHPSSANVDIPGASPVIELPVTENPLQPGTPIGLGFLNSHSVEATLRAIDYSAGAYATFLIHPWEGVDLPVRESSLPSWIQSACKSNLEPLERFLEAVKSKSGFTRVSELRERVS